MFKEIDMGWNEIEIFGGGFHDGFIKHRSATKDVGERRLAFIISTFVRE